MVNYPFSLKKGRMGFWWFKVVKEGSENSGEKKGSKEMNGFSHSVRCWVPHSPFPTPNSCHALPRRPPLGRRRAAPLLAPTAVSPPSSPAPGSKPLNDQIPPRNSTKNTSEPTKSNNTPPCNSTCNPLPTLHHCQRFLLICYLINIA